MVSLQIEHQGLHFLIRFLQRELSDIRERVGDAIACGSEGEERNLTAEENTCSRLLYACETTAERERQRASDRARSKT